MTTMETRPVKGDRNTKFQWVLASCLLLSLLSPTASAEMMTVRMLKDQYEQGGIGELAATAYVQGVVDGMLAMDSLAQKETGARPQWCGIEDAKNSGRPVRHPAYRTGYFLRAWEREGKSMDTIGPDFVLAILDISYGCKANR